ncbi:c-type cytochrome [Aliamphritea hakodatensis]|uniref:c-type cytochrome n=1 Tax=Aliamphritea hakodatensis TaxID=2895352 RepID=UPI0022FD399E|nr:cytochrome c [Aliamphritea hakodatensis]
MNKLITSFFTALAIGITVATPVSAHQGATGIVKERMDQMDIMKKSMKSMSAMFKGKTAYDAEAVRQHSRTIAKHSDTTLTKLFPEGSLQHASEAKPEIWQKWDKFELLSAELKRISEALERAADSRESDGGDAAMSMTMDTAMMTETAAGDTADSLFRELADTCSSCHTTFRKKKK